MYVPCHSSIGANPSLRYWLLQGDRCKLDIVSGCMDPGSDMFDPLATVDDGSCPLESDSEE